MPLIFQEKQEDLHWLLRCVLRTIEKSQSSGKLYVFMPEFYMENGIYLFQALWNYFLPLTSHGDIKGRSLNLPNLPDVKHLRILLSCRYVTCTRPCQETRAIALARAGTRVKYSASAIYRTRKILYFVDISNTEIFHMDS